jgi:REP element-mobilizing transposase RayT
MNGALSTKLSTPIPMPYWQLFYHIVWSTKNRESLITPEIEPRVYELVRSKAKSLEASVLALNGMADHVHLIVSIPPKVAIARFIGQIKGVTSTRLNQSHVVSHPFAWQDEYGVFSFDKKRLPPHVAYVEHQKEHHAQGTIIPLLERTRENQRPSSASQ